MLQTKPGAAVRIYTAAYAAVSLFFYTGCRSFEAFRSMWLANGLAGSDPFQFNRKMAHDGSFTNDP